MPDSLQHVGVLGMKWGHHKSMTEVQRRHLAKVQGLKQQIQKADLDNFNKASKTISKKEKEMNSKLDSIQKQKLSEIDSSKSMGKIQKFLAKATTKFDISTRRDNIIGELEDKYHFNPDKKRTAARKKSENKIFKKYDELYTKRFKELDGKKLNPFADIKEMLKIDRELSNSLTEELLKNELELEKQRFDD